MLSFMCHMAVVSHQAVHPLLGAAWSAPPYRQREGSNLLVRPGTGGQSDCKGADLSTYPNTSAPGHLLGLALQALHHARPSNLDCWSMEEAFLEDVESHAHDKDAPLRPLSFSQLIAMW